MEFQRYGIYFNSNQYVNDPQIGLTALSVRLPVNPSEITVTMSGETTTYNLINKGEVIIPRNTKLRTVEFSSFFPRNSYMSGTVGDSWYKPEGYVKFFNSLLEEKIVFRLVINRWDVNEEMFDTSFDAVLTGFTITDKGGEPGDIYYSLSVSEYRDTKPQETEIISEDEETDTTYLAIRNERDVPVNEIVVGDMVTVSGPCYETDDQSSWQSAKLESELTNAKGIVGRILPPSLVPGLDRIYLDGIGWVRKSDCIKGLSDNNSSRFGTLLGELKNAVT